MADGRRREEGETRRKDREREGEETAVQKFEETEQEEF